MNGRRKRLIAEIQRNLTQTEDDLRKATVNIHQARDLLADWSKSWLGKALESGPTKPRSSS